MSTTTSTTETEALKAQIDQQRSVLGRDLEALGDHVSPGRMVERRKAAAGQRVQRVKDLLMGTATSAGDRAGRAGSAVGDGAGSLAGAVGSGVDAVTGTVGTVVDSVQGAPQAAMERTQGAPLAMGLVSFGLGVVAGSLLPSTRREEQLGAKVEPTLHQVAEEAGTVARQGVEELKPVAQEAVQAVKEDATDAARTVQEKAQRGVTEVQDEARSATQQVADTAKGDSGPS